jgi:glutaconate CoA-transferase, subunit B
MSQLNGPTEPYSTDELMITALARCFADGDEVCNGISSFIPVAAIMLARLTHAPNLVWLAGAIGLDPRPTRVPSSTLEWPLWHDSVMYMEQYSDFWDYALNGRWLNKFCVGAAQVDRFGNANNTMIGDDFYHPKIRLPGTAALGDMGSIGKTLYYCQPSHSPRTFVERVDFISCAGYLDGGDSRDRLGLTGGPEIVVTNLAILDFEAESHAMQLRSVHPGVSLEEVQAATGFELVIPASGVGQTAPPSPEDVRLIRDVIDPDGVRKREVRVRR